MAAFNSERVARAIASSRLPVVSAVGHETDFTIADFAADLRAPTPSAAAELITEAQHKIAEHIAAQSNRLERAARFQLCGPPASHPPVRRPHRVAYRHGPPPAAQRLDDLIFRLNRPQRAAPPASARIAELAAAFLHHDPRHGAGPGPPAPRRFPHPSRPRPRAHSASLRRPRRALDARLHSLSPLAVLDRGYALVLAA